MSENIGSIVRKMKGCQKKIKRNNERIWQLMGRVKRISGGSWMRKFTWEYDFWTHSIDCLWRFGVRV